MIEYSDNITNKNKKTLKENFVVQTYKSTKSDKKLLTNKQISLLSLTKIAMALDMADDLRNLFTQVPYKNIQEVINENKYCRDN